MCFSCICLFALCVLVFVIILFLLVSGLAAVCDCGTSWTLLLTFLARVRNLILSKSDHCPFAVN